MAGSYIDRLFGDQNKKKLKKLDTDVQQVNALEEAIQKLSDEELQAKTSEFKKRLVDGETLEDIKHEAFAVVRETARRTVGQRHYDVQIIGATVLHSGAITEMRTGEGKTLSSTAPIYLNALEGKGVHVITVNDYLASRDADWMGQIFHFLGLTVGSIQNQKAFVYDADIESTRRSDEVVSEEAGNGASDEPSTEGEGYEALITADMDHMREVERREAYACDVTYGTNNEFGFDYLRDNMVMEPKQRVQRGLHYALIDEVDSILIDEARTPLIISAPAEEANDQYYQFATLVAALQENDHFTLDEKMKSVALTDAGIASLEKSLGVDNIYVASGLRTVHHIEQALKARMLFALDKDYVVRDDEVIIIDEFTGRMMQGRRYSEGLHQAIEAKENLPIKQESRTLATITLQNFFRMYDKLSGMTGTAETEAEEFFKIYGLDVVVIPTHREISRKDAADSVYQSRAGKMSAVVRRIKELYELGQPVLIGTISIEANEELSRSLDKARVPHNLLNAKQHQKEAEIIAQAGRRGSITVATNMAGRGVDIILGGNPVDLEEQRAVKELGGLAVIGTERHESRRIDNQLRGRAGRQGDIGSSQFFVSMDDELMRIFGSDRMKGFMSKLGVPEDMPIENKMVSRSIEGAQKKVEGRNFDIRKHLVEYDDVMNKHRDVVYRRRNSLLDMPGEELREYLRELILGEIEQIVSFHTNKQNIDGDDDTWDIADIAETMKSIFPVDTAAATAQMNTIFEQVDDKFHEAEARTAVIDYFAEQATAHYKKITEEVEDQGSVELVERSFSLRAIDTLWVEHLDQMRFLRDSIGLRGYGQRDPLVEYKRESYTMFQSLLSTIQQQIVRNIFKLRDAKVIHDKLHEQVQRRQYTAPAKVMEEGAQGPSARLAPQQVAAQAGQPAKPTEGATEKQPHVSQKKAPDGHKIGRNEPCHCGSGKKFKKCHGGNEQ